MVAALPSAGFLVCKPKGTSLVAVAGATALGSIYPGPPSSTLKAAGCFHSSFGKTQPLARFFSPKGGRMAVAVAAGSAWGGDSLPSADRKRAFSGVQLTRYGPPAAKSKELGVPARGGRLAVVVAAAPGESGDDLPPVDCEVAVSIYRMEMEAFKLSQRPVAFVGSKDDPLLDAASGTGMDFSRIVDFLLTKEPVRRDALKELVLAGQSFWIIESQSKECYMKADALVNAIQGMKLVGKTFFKDAKLPEYSAPVVPLSADDVDRDSFFKELVDLYVVFYTAVYWQARNNYGFGKAGAI